MSSIDQSNKKRKVLTWVAENAVCNILKDKDKWLSVYPDNSNKQKYKTSKYPELETKRFAELLEINDFKGSDGWVSNFKKRNNIKQYNLHGETSSAHSEEIIFKERRKL
ncbi:14522_t:CDS:2 [Entrophospora sp. SA101]|nr:14522_t:CDS:2 [Entrophospora sp. SA101]